MKRIKHSKIKNTGILFELLMRQVSADVISGTENSKALAIIREHFAKGCEIQKELELYHLLINHKFHSSSKANTLIEAVLQARSRLDNRKIRHQKYNIIKEIGQSFPVDKFFGSVVPHYTEYASVYKLFENAVSKESTDPYDITKSRHTLVEHICNKTKKVAEPKSKILEEFEKQPEEVRLLTTQILVNEFNEKFKDLSEKQKSLLREYVHDTAGSLKKYIESEIPGIKKELEGLAAKVADKVTKIKLTEVIKQLPAIIKGREVSDENMAAFMGYYSLIAELKGIK